MNLLNKTYKETGKLAEPSTPNQAAAALHGLTMAWEYCESIGKPLPAFTREEAATFSKCMTDGYTDKLREFSRPPFPAFEGTLV